MKRQRTIPVKRKEHNPLVMMTEEGYSTLEEFLADVAYYLASTHEFGGMSINLFERGWKVNLNTKKTVLGNCKAVGVTNKVISFSKPLVLLNLNNKEILNEVMTHEVAHAIEFEMCGRLSHSSTWKHIHVKLGGTGEVFLNPDKMEQGATKFTLVCDSCGHSYARHRTPSSAASCGNCSSEFDLNKLLRVIKNY